MPGMALPPPTLVASTTGMFPASFGLTRVPAAGRLARAFDRMTIQPVPAARAGRVKGPVKVFPAVRTISWFRFGFAPAIVVKQPLNCAVVDAAQDVPLIRG